MKYLREFIELVLVLLVIGFVIFFVFFREKPTPEIIKEEIIKYETIIDTVYATVPAEIIIDTVFVSSEAVVTETKAKATKKFQKDNLYKAEVNIEYYFNEELFNIDFNIEIQQKTKYITTTEKTTLSKPFFQPIVGLMVSNMPDGYGAGVNVGVRLADRFNLLLGVDTNNNLNFFVNYTI